LLRWPCGLCPQQPPPRPPCALPRPPSSSRPSARPPSGRPLGPRRTLTYSPTMRRRYRRPTWSQAPTMPNGRQWWPHAANGDLRAPDRWGLPGARRGGPRLPYGDGAVGARGDLPHAWHGAPDCEVRGAAPVRWRSSAILFLFVTHLSYAPTEYIVSPLPGASSLSLMVAFFFFTTKMMWKLGSGDIGGKF
jgi:hypothetical protein